MVHNNTFHPRRSPLNSSVKKGARIDASVGLLSWLAARTERDAQAEACGDRLLPIVSTKGAARATSARRPVHRLLADRLSRMP